MNNEFQLQKDAFLKGKKFGFELALYILQTSTNPQAELREQIKNVEAEMKASKQKHYETH